MKLYAISSTPLVESGTWTILIIKLCVAGNSMERNVEGISEVVLYELISMQLNLHSQERYLI